MRRSPILFALLAAVLAATARADFSSDARTAGTTIGAAMPRAESLLADGQFDQATAVILAIFPENSRTPAQTFLLANVLFSQDPKLSYPLHKRAAADLPNEPAVQLEWAMEQHRAGEYAGAAIAYAAYAKANPTQATTYGLMAECLLRTGKTAEDLALLRKTNFAPKDAPALAEMFCAGDCALAAAAEKSPTDVLRNAGFLLDDKSTLPANGTMLSFLLHVALSSKSISTSQAREKWGATILDHAKKSNDVDYFNIAANLYMGTDLLPDIDQLGWDSTADPRFAGSFLVSLTAKGALTLDHPALQKARKQFPDNAIIAQLAVALAAQTNDPKLLQPALIAAIQAEYTHFSPDRLSLRPSASMLRAYFNQLDKISTR